MIKDDINRMAREAGLIIDGNNSGDDDLFAFANLVAAAELRRLHAVNQELLKALKDMGARYGLTDVAREAIANAEGEQT